MLADDLLVVAGEDAFAGPRCIDLREASAARLGIGEPLGVVGVRERWRVVLGPVPPQAPLRGWVTLAWSDDVGVDVLRGPERMLALMPFRSVRLAAGASRRPDRAERVAGPAATPPAALGAPGRGRAEAARRDRPLRRARPPAAG